MQPVRWQGTQGHALHQRPLSTMLWPILQAHGMNPTQRTLNRLRREGWQVAVVEKWLKHPNMQFGRRIDVWNFGDILACRPADDRLPAVTALVQVTSGTHHADHRAKLQGRARSRKKKDIAEAKSIAAAVRTWKACGNVVWLISWSKSKDGRWTAREEQI